MIRILVAGAHVVDIKFDDYIKENYCNEKNSATKL